MDMRQDNWCLLSSNKLRVKVNLNNDSLLSYLNKNTISLNLSFFHQSEQKIAKNNLQIHGQYSIFRTDLNPISL